MNAVNSRVYYLYTVKMLGKNASYSINAIFVYYKFNELRIIH